MEFVGDFVTGAVEDRLYCFVFVEDFGGEVVDVVVLGDFVEVF